MNMRPTADLVDDMMAHCEEVTRQVLENREEILGAFIAKYGFHPDEAEQVHQGNSWFVVRIAPERVTQVVENLILARLNRTRISRWQRFCLWLAGWR